MNNDELTVLLNNLIVSCTAAHERFRTAAEKAGNPEFRRLFNVFSQQRAQFISELDEELHRLGGSRLDKENPESLEPSGARIASAARNGEAAVAGECQKGEESAVKNYEEVLRTDLPLDVQYVVKRQYMDIKDAFERLRILQRAA